MKNLVDALRNASDQYPGREAVRCQDLHLTYRQLWTQARTIASELVRLGVRKGDRVAIYTNKRVEAVAAIYGAMTAGAAYVPLDPFAPAERLRGIIEGCGVGAILIESARRQQAEQIAGGAPVLTVDGPIAQTPESLPELGPNDLAYILYTSGSTAPQRELSTRMAARWPSPNGPSPNSVCVRRIV